jgi:hypothetical protein
MIFQELFGIFDFGRAANKQHKTNNTYKYSTRGHLALVRLAELCIQHRIRAESAA